MSKPWRKVLCALQFDSSTHATVATARQIAAATGATVIFFHVVPVRLHAIGEPLSIGPAKGAEDDARMRLSNLADESPLLSHEIQVVTGDPAACIIDAALEQDIDVIVMATHGRAELSQLFLGSVAERVVRESPVPVTTMRIAPQRHRLLTESVLSA